MTTFEHNFCFFNMRYRFIYSTISSLNELIWFQFNFRIWSSIYFVVIFFFISDLELLKLKSISLFLDFVSFIQAHYFRVRWALLQSQGSLYMSDIRHFDIELVSYQIVKCLSWFVNQAGGISKLPIYKSIFMTVSLWTK